jgi:hypothetical protein
MKDVLDDQVKAPLANVLTAGKDSLTQDHAAILFLGSDVERSKLP